MDHGRTDRQTDRCIYSVSGLVTWAVVLLSEKLYKLGTLFVEKYAQRVLYKNKNKGQMLAEAWWKVFVF